MDDHYQTLSLRLYEIMDWIGASEEMRGKYRELSIVDDIVSNIVFNLCDDKPCNIFTFGSSCEGTTTTGLHSDKDCVFCFYEHVVEIICDASQHGLSYFMVRDDSTKPGYCKLQAVLNKVPMYHPDVTTEYNCEPDQFGRMCLHHLHEITGKYREINGPALTKRGEIGNMDRDTVFTLRCNHIPSFATSWVTRVTQCYRLSESQIQILTEFGCFFVGKNHPSSQNGPIEWRVSFSLQERELMSSLNPTQHKCYILLKMIKKDILHRRVPESISSYHCKTCLLYTIERTPCEFWTRRNLLECVLVCIKLLLYWVKKQFCPNYFIPEENMFDRIEQRTLSQLQSVLEDMVEYWCGFLWSITCDDICYVMSNVLFGYGPSIMKKTHNNVSENVLLLYSNLSGTLRYKTLVILDRCNSIVKLHSMQTNLLLTDCVRDNTDKETRQAIRYLIPHTSLQIAQCIASIMLTTIDTHRLRMLFGWFKYYIEESKNCDTISPYLIVASFCLQSDRNDLCANILLQCESSLKSHVVSICGCFNSQPMYRSEATSELERMICSQDIPYTEFARTCTTGCVVFQRKQSNLVPPALHYEMYRSVYTPLDSQGGGNDYWFDLMVVDSKVYLYFMQYILYSKTNKPIFKQDAVDNLIHVISTDHNLGHKETACNLMGWIFKQENKLQEAMESFILSLIIRPIHNAAKWHVLELIRSINSVNLSR